MASSRLLLTFLLHRSAVQGHMPWMTLNADQTGVEAYFGEGLIPDAGMITTLENITTLDLVYADGDKQKVPLVMEEGYMTGKLPEGFGRAALVAGFLDYGAFGSSALHYSFLAQANSADPSEDWEKFYQDFGWVDELYADTDFTDSPLFATMKNYGGPPYEIAVNGIPGMTLVEGCIYDVDADSGEEVKLGCTEQTIEAYDGDSLVVKVTSVERSGLCAGHTYLFRAKTRGNYDPKLEMNISSYATGSVVWDATGTTCLPDVPATSDADSSFDESPEGSADEDSVGSTDESGAGSYSGVKHFSAAGIGMMFCSYVLITM